MTFEEFSKLPDEVCRRSELRHGELIEVPPPLKDHVWIQQRLIELIRPHAERGAIVGMEIPFQPRPDYEYYRADVAYVSAERWRKSGRRGLEGSPELVIEILSPSNTAAEMQDRRKLFIETGCLEFWQINYKLYQIDVSTPDGKTTTYRRASKIPLTLFGGEIAVDEIFAGIED